MAAAGCRLPCWWGITPGETRWQEAKAMLIPFSNFKDQGPYEITFDGQTHVGYSHSVGFLLPGESREGGASFGEVDGLITSIGVGSRASKKGGFTLSELLSEYGMPDQVFLHVVLYVPFSGLPVELYLYYTQLNIFATFTFEGYLYQGKVCTQPQQIGPYLNLWSELSQFEARAEGTAFPEWILGADADVPQPIADVTELTVESFYERFKDPHLIRSLCVPPEPWE